MDFTSYLPPFVIAYLLGSIPAAVWIGRKFHNIDVREHGSGNAGTSNTIRVLGWKTGIPVLIVDMGKGWLATMLPVFFKIAEPGSSTEINLQIVAGLLATFGHVFPVFAGFRGGKGVATVFGALLAIQPLLTASCFGVFLIVFFSTGISSVSSMSAGIAFPLLLMFVFDNPSAFFIYFSVFVAIALLITHRKNIGRLIRGEEPKLLKFKKDKEK
ncbi:MAG TPA: glycerol-3-phosphate 1-O-acyltransferase PlsY [Bacteroidales bacterium]|nr:glycerol-3-phosphate 1-O-acyltransferase PlsY [Bacteroidales bacterium]